MMNCIETGEMISSYLDQELDEQMQKEFEAHIAECESCRQELLEVQRALEMVSSMEEEELPAGFQESLHNRLVTERQNADRKNRFLLWNKAAKICGTAAAVLILVFVFKGVIEKNLFVESGNRSRTETSSAAAEKADSALAAPVPASGQNNDIDGYSGTGSIRSADSSGSSPAVPMMESSINAKNDVKSQDIKPEAKKKSEEIPSHQAEMKAAKKTESTAGKYSAYNVQLGITVDNLSQGVQKIKDVLSQNSAEVVENQTVTFAMDQDHTAVPAANTNTTEVFFKVPSAQYQSLLAALKASLGEDAVTVLSSTQNDRENQINQLQDQLTDLDGKLAKAAGDSGSAGANDAEGWKEQRASVQKTLEDLKKELEYTSGTLEIKTK